MMSVKMNRFANNSNLMLSFFCIISYAYVVHVIKTSKSTSGGLTGKYRFEFETICGSIHLKIFTFLSLNQKQSSYIYIYIYICVHEFENIFLPQ